MTLDPISAALRKINAPIDMELPEYWSWIRLNHLCGYLLRYRKAPYYREFFFGDEDFSDERLQREYMVKEKIYEFAQMMNAVKSRERLL